MALQVWLPLTKDLRNQGLSNLSFTNYGGTYSSTGGKLGGYYSFSGSGTASSNEIASTQNCPITGDASYSIAFWFYWNGDSWSNDYVGVVGWGNQSTATGAWACLYNGKPDLDFWNCRYIATNQLSVKTWYHVAFTKQSGTGMSGHIYVNGIEVAGSSAGSSTPNIASNKVIIGRLNSAMASRSFNGKVCDVRIYDHCLSPIEVKQLSRGLVLHYHLSRNNETLVPYGYQRLEYIESSGTSYFNTNCYFNPETDSFKIDFKGNDTNNNGMILANSDRPYIWVYYYKAGSNIKIYADNGSGQQSTGGITQDLNRHILEFKNKHCYIDSIDKGSLTNTYVQTSQPLWLFSYNNSTNYPFKGRIYYTHIIRNGKFERLFIPAKRLSDSTIGMYDLIYGEFYTSVNSAFTAGPIIGSPTTIYDCSGYGNNGVITGNIANSAETKKYLNSIYLPNTTTTNTLSDKCWITTPLVLNSATSLTVSLWFKNEAITRGGLFTTGPANTTSTTLAINDYDNNVRVVSSDNTGIVPGGYSNLTSSWCHWVLTFDGINAKIYVNGVLKGTASYNTTKVLTNISQITLGANSAGGVYRSAKGYYSDVRVYTTALSAEDVLDLYNNKI